MYVLGGLALGGCFRNTDRLGIIGRNISLYLLRLHYKLLFALYEHWRQWYEPGTFSHYMKGLTQQATLGTNDDVRSPCAGRGEFPAYN